MAENLTDEEQLQILKNWWKENGLFLIVTLVIGFSAYFGWQWWNRYEKNYAAESSTIYRELIQSVSVEQGKTLTDEQKATATFLAEQLQNDYSRSLYSVNASLLLAKLAVDDNDLDSAEQQLKTAIKLGDEDTQTIAELRLSKVYFAQEKYDDALMLTQRESEDEFSGLFAALRGDILVSLGQIEEARATYSSALNQLTDDNRLQKRLVEIKLADLGGSAANNATN